MIGGIHCTGMIVVTPLDHKGCTSRGWGIHEATVGKELCGALLGSLTSAYHWVGVICNGGWYREGPFYPADRNPSKWVQADGSLVPPSASRRVIGKGGILVS